jgi:molecular chaperone DnaK (HSP70)
LLTVTAYDVGKIQPYSTQLLQESKAKLLEIERKDKERVLLEEARNKVEGYIYHIKNKLVDAEDAIAKVSTEEQRTEISKLAEDAEEWMYDDGAKAGLDEMVAKYAELSTPAEKIFLRVSETTARPEAIVTLQAKLTKIEELMTKWETTMPQVTKEERDDVLEKVANVRKWISEKEDAQAKLGPTEEPAFLSSDVAVQSKPAESLVARLSR